MAAYSVQLTPTAERQLSREMRYSRQRWGKTHQQAFRQDLRRYIARLADDPHIHRKRPESFDMRVARWKGLRIVYDVDDEKRMIVIVAFVGRNRLIETALAESP